MGFVDNGSMGRAARVGLATVIFAMIGLPDVAFGRGNRPISAPAVAVTPDASDVRGGASAIDNLSLIAAIDQPGDRDWYSLRGYFSIVDYTPVVQIAIGQAGTDCAAPQ